ncbi:MAG TPA: hypothetical protein VGP80_12250 [Gemmatimonadales bacterium]|nr:hypothetical protein [Gemmatimonadales bacterium]
MPLTPSAAVTLTALALLGLTIPAWAQRPDSTLLRPTTVIVRILNDPDPVYNGVFQASGISTKCGLADYGYPHRANSFAVMFPDDTTMHDVTSVNFDADTLAAGTTVSSYYLAVGVRVGSIGSPLFVIRANDPQYNEPGTAIRTRTAGGIDSLVVAGTATKGRKVQVEMTLVCQP